MICKQIIDLTHDIQAQMPVFPGSLSPQITEVANHEKDGYLEHSIKYYSHTGTHIDAPAHISNKYKKLSDYPLSSFMGKGVCLDVSHIKVIDETYIMSKKHELKNTDFALFCSGKALQWGSKEYLEGYSIISEYAAQLLSTFNLKGIGMDTISPDPIDSTDLIAHKTLLKNNILIIENLNCMENLMGKEFTFLAIPLKIVVADGGPVRAFALFND